MLYPCVIEKIKGPKLKRKKLEKIQTEREPEKSTEERDRERGVMITWSECCECLIHHKKKGKENRGKIWSIFFSSSLFLFLFFFLLKSMEKWRIEETSAIDAEVEWWSTLSLLCLSFLSYFFLLLFFLHLFSNSWKMFEVIEKEIRIERERRKNRKFGSN